MVRQTTQRILRTTLSALAASLIPVSAFAAAGDLLLTIPNPTPAKDDLFGQVVQVSGKNIIVSATNESSSSYRSGAVYVFSQTGALKRTVNCPTSGTLQGFGDRLAVSGNSLLACAPFEDIETTGCAGTAHLVDVNKGTVLRSFANPSPEEYGVFGFSAGVAGNRLLIGCPGDSTQGSRVGIVYAYNKKTGSALAPLLSPDPTLKQHFGISMTVLGSTAYVGASGDTAAGDDVGAVHVYNARTGGFLRTIASPMQTVDTNFGEHVAASAKYIAVAATSEDIGSTASAGVVYLFDAKTFSFARSIPNPNPSPYCQFGNALAFSGKNLVIGSAGDGADGDNSGRVYVYDPATGNLLVTLHNQQTNTHGRFGTSVAASATKIYVGAPDNSEGDLTDAGQVFVFSAK